MVAFYIMSSGTHPYERNGETFLTECNIVHDSPDLSAVQDKVACDIVASMLAADPPKRPSAAQLLR